MWDPLFTFTPAGAARFWRNPRENGLRSKIEKASLAHRPSQWRYATPSRRRRPWGVKGSLLDVTVKPGRLRQTTLRCSRGGWAVRSSNHGPLNPRAQCNQERKFCQEANAPESTKSCCRVFKLSIPSGAFPRSHKRKKRRRTRNFSTFARGPRKIARVHCEKTARSESRHKKKSDPDRQRVFQDCDHKIRNL